EGPPGPDSGLLTDRSVPSPVQIASASAGPGSTARKVTGSVHDFPETSVTITVPWPSSSESVGSTRKSTEASPLANSSTVSVTFTAPSPSRTEPMPLSPSKVSSPLPSTPSTPADDTGCPVQIGAQQSPSPDGRMRSSMPSTSTTASPPAPNPERTTTRSMGSLQMTPKKLAVAASPSVSPTGYDALDSLSKRRSTEAVVAAGARSVR